MQRWVWTGILLVAVLGFLGCAGPAPEARKAAAETYPENRFLTAEAVGESEASAKRAALAELAAIFDAKVYAQTVQQARSWLGSGLPEQFERQVEQTIRIHTDVQLAGARIARVQAEEDSGGFRALAVLNRRQAADRWQRELDDNRVVMEGQLAALQTVEGRLSRLAAINRLTTQRVRQAVIASRLSVLGRTVPPDDDDSGGRWAEIVAERQALARDAALFIEIRGPLAGSFTRRLKALLADGGYVMAADREAAAGLIDGDIVLQPLDLGNPQVHFIRAIAGGRLVDADTGAPIAAFDENRRSGHLDAQEAARRSVAGVADQVADLLAGAMGTLGLPPP